MSTIANVLYDIIFFGSLAALPGIAAYYIVKLAARRRALFQQNMIVEEVTVERID